MAIAVREKRIAEKGKELKSKESFMRPSRITAKNTLEKLEYNETKTTPKKRNSTFSINLTGIAKSRIKKPSKTKKTLPLLFIILL